MPRAIDYTNKKFGSLTVVKPTDERKDGRVVWECLCSCGNTCYRLPQRMRDKESRCEECYSKQTAEKNRTHGMCGTDEYNIWCDIVKRTSPGHIYHERGIYLCEEWRHDFLTFYGEVGKRPSKQHSIDRINTLKGYEPGNVKWSLQIDQVRNRRLQKNNTTGYCGVQENEMCFMAVWSENGKNKYKRFNKRKYGDNPAKELAIKYREDMIKKLISQGENYTEFHGKSALSL